MKITREYYLDTKKRKFNVIFDLNQWENAILYNSILNN